MSKLKLLIKKILFPGLDISTRKRMKFVKYFDSGDILTLDAGCGNGAFSFAAYKKGNRVLGIDFDPAKLKKCEEFRDYLKIDSSRCEFKVFNIYKLEELGRKFDQIICFETLEHLKNDKEIIGEFSQILKRGGTLHISVPSSERKFYYGEKLSQEEDGGHMRLGYSHKELEEMLKKSGFEIIKKDGVVGFFGKILLNINQWIGLSRITIGLPSRIRDSLNALILLFIPITFLDNILPSKPFNVFIKAKKI